jgi:hypothetical protein
MDNSAHENQTDRTPRAKPAARAIAAIAAVTQCLNSDQRLATPLQVSSAACKALMRNI